MTLKFARHLKFVETIVAQARGSMRIWADTSKQTYGTQFYETWTFEESWGVGGEGDQPSLGSLDHCHCSFPSFFPLSLCSLSSHLSPYSLPYKYLCSLSLSLIQATEDELQSDSKYLAKIASFLLTVQYLSTTKRFL